MIEIKVFKKIRLKLWKISFLEKFLIISLVIISVAAYVFMSVNALELTDGIVNVEQNGQVILQLSSEQINKDGIYNFAFDKGKGQIEVKDRKVRMLPMNRSICPRAICSETGWIENSLKAIVCLPNRLVVSVEKDTNSKVDEIAF